MWRHATLLLGATLCACAERATPNQRWIGSVTSTSPATCPSTRGVAILRNGALTFAPDEGTWVLLGVATSDGVVEADKDRAQTGRSTQVYETHFQGRWTEAELNGVYTTPKCRYDVALKRF